MASGDLHNGVFIGRGVLFQLIGATGLLCFLLFGCGFLVGAFWFEAARGDSVAIAGTSSNTLAVSAEPSSEETVPANAFEYLPGDSVEPLSVPEPGPEVVAETTERHDRFADTGSGAPWIGEPAHRRKRRTQKVGPGPAIDRNFGSIETIEMPAFRATPETPSSPYQRVIRRVSREQGVSPLMVTAVIAVESSFKPNAVSNKGAKGLMQLMPDTARRFGVDPDDLFDPNENLRAGCAYLRWLAERFDDDPVLVLAAYNAGEGAVDTYGGIPPFPETQNFVRKVYRELGWESVEPLPARRRLGNR